MDPLAGFLDGPRARSAFLLRCMLDPPWFILVQDEAPLAVLAVTHGRAWLVRGSADDVLLAEGDLAIVRGPDHYVVADDPATPPDIVIDPGEVCRTPEGVSLHDEMALGMRTWGNSDTGETTMLVGTYLSDGEVSRVLLDALPPVVVVRSGEWDNPLRDLLAEEMVKDEPGQQVVLDRFLDLLLVSALRAAFIGGMAAPRWYLASADPVIGNAVRLLHDQPAEPWTVANLARAVGVSRAHLARRFHGLVGEPPMTFLTAWRMALAADRLCADDATVTTIAGEVGYANPFTFSTAFKRHYGISPRAYRAARTA